MNEKKKDNIIKLVIALALVCVCVAAVIGITAIIRNNKDPEPVVTDTLAEDVVQVEEIEVPVISGEDLEIEIDLTDTAANTMEQEIQPEAEVVEEPEAPEPIGDVTNPENPPVYDLPDPEPQPSEPEVKPDVPSDAEQHPGQIYIQGWGWMTPTGGQSIPAPDLYPNGNIIGDM